MIQKLMKLLLIICIFSIHTMYAQSTVTGTITDASDGMELPSVTVLEKGTSNGTTTDFNGTYTIQVSNQNAVLQFSSLGYATKEITVNGQTVINVALEQSAEALDEIVVTALGIKKETKALGYSLTQVDGKALSDIKTPNAVNALQGKIAGVNITQNSTGAGGSSRVVIRGASSLAGNNQPLYVVDGIPIGNDNNGSASLWGGNDGGDGISSLNPDDIESVSALKGGAAAALYGSRASGGVIIITTKSGKQQKGFGVEVSSQILFDNVNTSLQDFQTQYGQGLRGAKPVSQTEALDAGLSSWGPRFDGTDVVQFDGVSRPYSYVGNNVDKFYKTGTTFINTVALSNSTETSNYRFSVSDFSNNDIIPNAGLNRKSFSLNASSVLAEKLTTSVNVKYIIEDVTNRPRLSDSPGNANFAVALLPGNLDVGSLLPATNEDGSERQYYSNTFFTNPYFSVNNFRNEDVRNRIVASTSLRYDMSDGFYLSGRMGVDHSTRKSVAVEPYGTGFKPLGGINESERRYTQIDADIMLGAERAIDDQFSVNAFIGANSNSQKREQLNLGGNDFIVPGLEDLSNTLSQSRSRSFTESKIGSLYGSVEVSYDKWAYVTFTGRNDWFSTLSFPGKTTPNDDFYSSLSASVILSEVLELPSEINFLKLRGGYSQVAGGAPDPYSLSLTYEIFGQSLLGQPTGQIFGNQVPNANITPFEKTEFEIGFDARLLNNRLSLDVAYYANETIGDIVGVSASQTSGFGSALANLGKISNKGIEVLISGSPIKTEDFTWNSSFNISHNKGIVTATNDGGDILFLDEPRTRNIRIAQIVDENFGSLYGVSYERDANGTIMYNIDGDGVPRAVEGARKLLGQGVPPTTIGFSNSFKYKDFSLNVLIDGKFGGQIFSGTNTLLYRNGLHQDTAENREALTVSGIDAATGDPFTTTVAPENLAIYYGEIADIAEEFVEDSDFIKLRQLSVGYNVPNKFLEKTFLQSATISVIASNLFYLKRSIDNIDPESAYSAGNSQGLEYFGVPSTRSYGLNFNIKF
ncbi:MAG: SusC/RagA family TonB-linked outer membrane protein [Polaribacter sp.]